MGVPIFQWSCPSRMLCDAKHFRAFASFSRPLYSVCPHVSGRIRKIYKVAVSPTPFYRPLHRFLRTSFGRLNFSLVRKATKSRTSLLASRNSTSAAPLAPFSAMSGPCNMAPNFEPTNTMPEWQPLAYDVHGGAPPG